jgi:hypothetical protein
VVSGVIDTFDKKTRILYSNISARIRTHLEKAFGFLAKVELFDAEKPDVENLVNCPIKKY